MRAGKIKIPVGLYNETRDMDMLRTCILLPQGIYNDLLRDNLLTLSGASIYGNRDLGEYGGISYPLVSGVLPSDAEGGTGKYLNSSLSGMGVELDGDYNPRTSYSGALWWETPLEGLKAGNSFFHSGNDLPVTVGGVISSTLEGLIISKVFSVEYSWNDLVLVSEYMERESQKKLLTNESSSTLQSYYFLASYAFNDWFTLGSYYSVVYPDKDDKDGLNKTVNNMAWEKDIALTFRFDINEYWVIKVEGHKIDGTANVLVVDNPNNSYAESDFYYGAAKVTVSF